MVARKAETITCPPPPPALAPLRDLSLLSPCFVVIYMLVLSPKCQGQCLIHAAPPTPLGT